MGFFDNGDFSVPPEGRVEGVAKVTGSGKYTAEYKVANCCYGVLVGSAVPSGTIKNLAIDEAKQASGVLAVLSHLDRPDIPGFATAEKIKETRLGLPIFHTDKIYFTGQPIALVVAETPEEATYAASLITAVYNKEPFEVDFNKARRNIPLAETGKDLGETAAWNKAVQTVEKEYHIAQEVHNPMEAHATIAEWIGEDKLRLYDKNQGVNNVQRTVSGALGIPAKNVEVVSEFVGGGFGSGLRVWPHTMAAVMAAKQLKRPVKIILTRPQMFWSVGYRPETWQRIKLAGDKEGRFCGIIHQAQHSTSKYENFSEGVTRITRMLYNFGSLRTEQSTVPLNLCTPTWMRAPGDCTGAFALESAIDELSYLLKIDPVELRLKNIALKNDPESGKPWSTNYVDECIRRGAEKISWTKRKSTPAQLSEGVWKVGYGMALGMWGSGRAKASAAVKLNQKGEITVETAMTDIGTGTGAAIQSIAHEATGIPKSKIKVALGNSNLPPAPSQGGSTGLSSVGAPVLAACNALKKKLLETAQQQNASLKDADVSALQFEETGLFFKDKNTRITYADLWSKGGLTIVAAEVEAAPGDERKPYSFCSSAAHYCVVKVHEKTGKVKVTQYVCVADGGKIVNHKTAANQMSGAVAGGIGMALMEEQITDNTLGSLIGADLAGYHFAVNADVPIVEIDFINKPDFISNPVGSKGLGEVGIIGAAAAVANAIYNATGKRLRNLPMTPDKIVM